MIEPQTPDRERVLVLAPTAADAALSRSILAEAGLACHVCGGLREVSRDLASAAGAILLTDEVIADRDIGHLVEVLQSQPTWSDVPILVLLGSGAESSAAPRAMELLGNVTMLERPVRVTTLVSALRTAIRARRRQYELHDQLADLTQAEKSLRKQSERLRLLWEAASVLLTSDEPQAMMQALFAKIAPHFALDAYFNFSVNDAGDALRLESCAGIPEEETRKIAQRQQAIVATRTEQTGDPMRDLIEGYGFRAYASGPLMAEGRLLGTLSFAGRLRDPFDADELEFLQTINRYVTVAYERMRLIRQLRDTDRRKDEFLATLAHELRNPLAPIRNALQIMRLTGNDKAAVEQARVMMDRQLGQMVRLIDDLLDVSRITRGKLELRKERVELAAVIKNAVDTARPHIEASGHELFVSVPTQPVYFDADPVRIAQVLSNLLNNAAKYMERGGKIWLAAQRRGNLVDVSVRDTGIGIPAEALSSIFDMFAQVDNSLEKSHGGLGIGLTLVKRLVEMHGGSVEARSEGIGRGAEFTARLPVVAESPASHADSGDDERQPSAVKCRILVADDNGDAAESMGMMLRLMGNEVRTVRDGVEAVEEAAAFRPDVILLDIGMPRLNGYDAARRIREQRWGKGMFLVALTGWGQDEDKRRAAEAGFDLHFTKPVNPEELEQLVAGLHTHSNARANVPTAG